jgi:hypothetical protein
MVDVKSTFGGMETELIDHPSTILTSPTGEAVIPAPLRRFNPTVAKPSEIKELKRLPDLTVVRTERIDTLLSHKTFLRVLSDRLDQTPGPSKIVFLFTTKHRQLSDRESEKKLIALFTYFTRPFDLEVAQGIEAAVEAFREALAKIVATRKLIAQKGPDRDELGKLKRVIKATADLRTSSGKLSATNVATAFGLSVAELAALIGRSRQAVSKTPDADSLQPLLGPFERVARLRAMLSPDDFRKWLHLANEHLDNRMPLELIRQGKVGVIAELVEDMLTGSPT